MKPRDSEIKNSVKPAYDLRGGGTEAAVLKTGERARRRVTDGRIFYG